MGIEIEFDKEFLNTLIKEVDLLSKLELQVGIFGSSGSDILLRAHVHEFGSAVRNIPERSFIRAGIKEHEGDIEKQAESIIDNVVNGNASAKQGLEILGSNMVDYITSYLLSMSSPALKPITIERKGSSSLLVDTGQLVGAIDYKVV